MKKIIQGLNKGFSPVLILSFFATCLILLAATPKAQALPMLSAILWATGMTVIMRWGIWGILRMAQARFRAEKKALTVLVRTVEGLELLLSLAAVVFALILREIPAVWLFLPAALFGLQGAIKFDAKYII